MAAVLLIATVAAVGGLAGGVGVAHALPPRFVDELVASIPAPTALAFLPDKRMLVTTQGGTVRIVKAGTLLAAPALDLTATICSNSERGMLGIAVDPGFNSNGFVYLYYSLRMGDTCDENTVNRVSRFVMNGNTLGGEVVLIDNIPSPAGNHNGGDLHIGKDRMLYVSIGDGGCDYLVTRSSGCGLSNVASRDRNVLLGKILRITRDGRIPSTNPFQGDGTARCNRRGRTAPGLICQETFAWGLRNPFRTVFDPNANDTRFFINDVGQTTWEEIDDGTSGADYGWNVREGHCAAGSTTDCGAPPAGMTNPIFDYGHDDGCSTITGGAFVPKGVWPPVYDGAYFFSDFTCHKLFQLVPNSSGGFTRTAFEEGSPPGSAVDMAFGPYGRTQALYYTTYRNGGEVRRLRNVNVAPTAKVTAAPTSGPAPLSVVFDGSGSSDVDGDALTYQWRFGDGATATTTSPITNHTYASAGRYSALLRVRDARGALSPFVKVVITAT